MRVNVVVVGDDGKAYGATADLSPIDVKDVDTASYGASRTDAVSGVDLDLPVRPFMKRYGADKSGPKRFVLLLAHMTRGAAGARVHISDIQKLWNTMGGLIGGDFNSAYPTRAKDGGWVDATKSGEYSLLPRWTEVV